MRFGYPGIKLAFWIVFVWAFAALAHCQVISIECGSPTDQYFVGGTAFQDASMGGPPLNALRYGPRFSYRVPAPPGIYLIKLSFVEPNATAIGRRIFNVSVNGQTSDGIDLFKLVGLKTEYILQTTAISYWGFVKLDFAGVIGNAVVSQIQLAKYPIDAFSIGWQQVASSFECLTITPNSSCVGMRAATFKRPDGTETPPFILVPGVDVDLADSAKWKPSPIL